MEPNNFRDWVKKNRIELFLYPDTPAQIHAMRLDLWNTTLTHLCTPAEPTATETCTCICCLRPILRHALHTRTFQWYDDSMHVVTDIVRCWRTPDLPRAGFFLRNFAVEHVRNFKILTLNTCGPNVRRLAQQPDRILSCHLCLSVFKSIREIETDSCRIRRSSSANTAIHSVLSFADICMRVLPSKT